MTRANTLTLAAYAAVIAVMAMWMLVLRGEMQVAAAQRAQCLTTVPNHDRADSLRGIRACTALIEAGRKTPYELADLHFRRGFHHMGAQNCGQAIEDFTDAIKYRPDFPEAYANRGGCYSYYGKNAEALADFDHALKLDPADAFTLAMRGQLHDGMEQPAKADADFARAEKLAPKDPQVLAVIGRHRALRDKCTEAEQFYRRALKADPADGYGWLQLGRCQARTGRDRDAIASFDKALALGRNDDALYERAEANARLERYDRAVADISLMLMQGGADAGLEHQRCWYRAVWGRELREALEDCNAAFAMAGEHWDFLDARGLVHLRLGEWQAAVADYDVVLAKGPQMETALYGRGIARKRLGDAGGDKDIAAALDIMPGVARDFEKMGLRP